MGKKTDNHNPEAKLALRRYFLRKYHNDTETHVFDCCQGGCVMWSTLRREFKIDSYWGVDEKPKKGRMKINSVRVVTQGIPHNVIDVDTYGSPWKHWDALLPHVCQPTTVYLTIGSTMMKGATDSVVLDALGCNFRKLKLPESFCRRLDEIGVKYVLAKGLCQNIIVEAVESVSTGNARYIGVHLQPQKVAHRADKTRRADTIS